MVSHFQSCLGFISQTVRVPPADDGPPRLWGRTHSCLSTPPPHPKHKLIPNCVGPLEGTQRVWWGWIKWPFMSYTCKEVIGWACLPTRPFLVFLHGPTRRWEGSHWLSVGIFKESKESLNFLKNLKKSSSVLVALSGRASFPKILQQKRHYTRKKLLGMTCMVFK